VGPSPVDRGRPGSKHYLIVDAHGLPLVEITIRAAASTRRPVGGWRRAEGGRRW